MPKKVIKIKDPVIIKELDNNIVRDYLTKNNNLKLSCKSLSKRLNIKRQHVKYLCANSNNIRTVEPYEVGSYKCKLDVYTSV